MTKEGIRGKISNSADSKILRNINHLKFGVLSEFFKKRNLGCYNIMDLKSLKKINFQFQISNIKKCEFQKFQ